MKALPAHGGRRAMELATEHAIPTGQGQPYRPRGESVRYDAASDSYVVGMTDGSTTLVPREFIRSAGKPPPATSDFTQADLITLWRALAEYEPATDETDEQIDKLMTKIEGKIK